MRLLLVLAGIAALLVLAAMVTGFIDIDQTRGARLPGFHANVARIELGTQKKTIDVPAVTVQKPGDNAAAPR